MSTSDKQTRMFLVSRCCIIIFADNRTGGIMSHLCFCERDISWTLSGVFIQWLHKCPLWLKDDLIQFWRSKVKGHSNPPVSWTDISRTPWGIFIKSGTNPHLDSAEVKGHWNLTSCERESWRTPWGNFVIFGTNICIHWYTDWLDFGGPRSKVIAASMSLQSRDCLEGVSSNLVHRSTWTHG